MEPTLDEARAALRTFAEGGNPVGLRAACAAVLARLDTIDRRGQQIRGGLKPHATSVETVDFMLAEPQRPTWFVSDETVTVHMDNRDARYTPPQDPA